MLAPYPGPAPPPPPPSPAPAHHPPSTLKTPRYDAKTGSVIFRAVMREVGDARLLTGGRVAQVATGPLGKELEPVRRANEGGRPLVLDVTTTAVDAKK